MKQEQAVENFHNHLDRCAQCRERPFELCPVGAALIRLAVPEVRR